MVHICAKKFGIDGVVELCFRKAVQEARTWFSNAIELAYHSTLPSPDGIRIEVIRFPLNLSGGYHPDWKNEFGRVLSRHELIAKILVGEADAKIRENGALVHRGKVEKVDQVAETERLKWQVEQLEGKVREWRGAVDRLVELVDGTSECRNRRYKTDFGPTIGVYGH